MLGHEWAGTVGGRPANRSSTSASLCQPHYWSPDTDNGAAECNVVNILRRQRTASGMICRHPGRIRTTADSAQILRPSTTPTSTRSPLPDNVSFEAGAAMGCRVHDLLPAGVADRGEVNRWRLGRGQRLRRASDTLGYVQEPPAIARSPGQRPSTSTEGKRNPPGHRPLATGRRSKRSTLLGAQRCAQSRVRDDLTDGFRYDVLPDGLRRPRLSRSTHAQLRQLVELRIHCGVRRLPLLRHHLQPTSRWLQSDSRSTSNPPCPRSEFRELHSACPTRTTPSPCSPTSSVASGKLNHAGDASSSEYDLAQNPKSPSPQ